MGLPAGWVCVDIPRNAQLKALGNGVVPQQAALVLRLLLNLPAAPIQTHGDLLPTPAERHGRRKTVDAWDTWTATMQAKHGNGNGHGKSLHIEAKNGWDGPTDALRPPLQRRRLCSAAQQPDGYCKGPPRPPVNHGDVVRPRPLGDRGGLYAALGKPIPHGVPRLIGRNADDCPKCAEVANLAAHGMDFHEIADRLSGCTDTYDRRRTLRKHLTGHGRTDLLAKITPQQESSAAQQRAAAPHPIQPRTPGGKPEPGAWRQDRPAPPEPLPDWMEPRPSPAKSRACPHQTCGSQGRPRTRRRKCYRRVTPAGTAVTAAPSPSAPAPKTASGAASAPAPKPAARCRRERRRLGVATDRRRNGRTAVHDLEGRKR